MSPLDQCSLSHTDCSDLTDSQFFRPRGAKFNFRDEIDGGLLSWPGHILLVLSGSWHTQSGSGARGLLLVTRRWPQPGEHHVRRLIGHQHLMLASDWSVRCRGSGHNISPCHGSPGDRCWHIASSHQVQSFQSRSSTLSRQIFLFSLTTEESNVVSATESCLLLWAIISSVTTSHVFAACNWIQ